MTHLTPGQGGGVEQEKGSRSEYEEAASWAPGYYIWWLKGRSLPTWRLSRVFVKNDDDVFVTITGTGDEFPVFGWEKRDDGWHTLFLYQGRIHSAEESDR